MNFASTFNGTIKELLYELRYKCFLCFDPFFIDDAEIL